MSRFFQASKIINQMIPEKRVFSDGFLCETDSSRTGFLKRQASGVPPNRSAVVCSSSEIRVVGRSVSVPDLNRAAIRSSHDHLFSTVLKLLSPIRPIPRTITPPPKKDSHMTPASPSAYDSESSTDTSPSSPATPTEAHTTLQTLLYRGVDRRVEEMPSTIVYIDLVKAPLLASERSWTPSSEALAEERSWSERGCNVARASQHPRHITEIEPTITFMSPTPVSARSHFTVHTEEGIIFSESTPLEAIGSSPASEADRLYRTLLIPGFWETIVHSAGTHETAFHSLI